MLSLEGSRILQRLVSVFYAVSERSSWAVGSVAVAARAGPANPAMSAATMAVRKGKQRGGMRTANYSSVARKGGGVR